MLFATERKSYNLTILESGNDYVVNGQTLATPEVV